MPKKNKTLCVDDLRHAEYYGMQETFDELYQKSKNGEVFKNLMDLILSQNNILLAYRNIKANGGSYTAGTDKQNITDIGSKSPDEVVEKVRFIVTGSKHGYRPKPVRRKDIPKPNGKTRPLGIPCIWDRLIQQCIKQILEPICEAKFSNNSYGFRPNRSVEHAINRTYTMLQRMNLHYVIEFDIKGFFDNVNHSKLIKQMWSLGIQDKRLIFVIRRILKATIKMPDGSLIEPHKGTPQGGIISPLLANIALNELDWWVASQWEENPMAVSRGRYRIIGNTEVFDKSHGYRLMKNTKLKEMHIIRYADDFRIFCRTKGEAVKTKEAVTKWIEERLKLEVSPEKTRIVNTRKRWSEFLGFKIRVRSKSHKYVVQSSICDKKVEIETDKLVEQAKNIAKPREMKSCLSEIQLFNSMVLGIQNYYQLATCISIDCRNIHRRIMTVLTNRLTTEKGCMLKRDGGTVTEAEKERFGNSKMIRYVSGIDQMIYPIAYIKNKIPMAKKSAVCSYTSDGRELIHTELKINRSILKGLREQLPESHSTEYYDCRISLFSAQKGKCAVSGEEFVNVEDIATWLKTPKELGGYERYKNMTLIHKKYQALLDETPLSELKALSKQLKTTKKMMIKINSLREQAGLLAIE
ncbi:TPA: group II intron reverse transcriptase/maturase [Streptococcus pyogenes]|nr:group II intron reverse transcriptase/maturase [Streptococcus pyogenes]HEQ6374370.1 group II intron reverse transcriptase/maturase [Streptococcus pyogenes]HEQ8212006.1 group II intron reverse transcriptase/maturase [Streptococcus pyogenes]HEQ8212551.1 group II intron reverse transcriptase/maturase [Streptococcus pyogenes]HES0846066.1 group II intron reverse transcriptase/maturase [Streptococcus pyogenes]